MSYTSPLFLFLAFHILALWGRGFVRLFKQVHTFPTCIRFLLGVFSLVLRAAKTPRTLKEWGAHRFTDAALPV